MAHDPAIKAQAIALLLAGTSIGKTADKLGIAKSSVSNWYKEIKGDAPRPKNNTNSTANSTIPQVHSHLPESNSFNTNSTVPSTQKKTRAELLDTLIDAKLETLIAQLEHFRDKEWLQRQSAGDLALLFGIEMDKAVRMLELIEKGKALKSTDQGALPFGGNAS